MTLRLPEILKILAQDKKRKADEYRTDLETVTGEQQKLEARISECEARRRPLLLTGTDAELEAIEQEMRTLNRDADRASAAIEELKRRLEEAEKTEHLAEIEAAAKRAKKAQLSALKNIVELDAVAVRLGELVATINEHRQTIREANKYCSENGRADLRVPGPEYILTEHVGFSTPDALPPFWRWELPGYFPQLHPRGRLLGRAKELT